MGWKLEEGELQSREMRTCRGFLEEPMMPR